MRIKLLLIGALAFCWGAFSTPASAQTISCASQDNGRQYCGADTRGGVTLIRQNSNSPCIENQTWGYDGRGIWVDRGCRAEFQVGNFYPGGPGGPGSRGDTISCESTNNRINYCRIDNVNSNVEVIQQLSQSPCPASSQRTTVRGNSRPMPCLSGTSTKHSFCGRQSSTPRPSSWLV
jgi:hypothetical protein